MFDGTSFGGLVLLRRQRRFRGVYWSIFHPALIRMMTQSQRIRFSRLG